MSFFSIQRNNTEKEAEDHDDYKKGRDHCCRSNQMWENWRKKKNLKKEKILTRASGTTAIFLNFNVDSVINDSFQTSQCIDMKNRDISNNTRRNPWKILDHWEKLITIPRELWKLHRCIFSHAPALHSFLVCVDLFSPILPSSHCRLFMFLFLSKFYTNIY